MQFGMLILANQVNKTNWHSVEIREDFWASSPIDNNRALNVGLIESQHRNSQIKVFADYLISVNRAPSSSSRYTVYEIQ